MRSFAIIPTHSTFCTLLWSMNIISYDSTLYYLYGDIYFCVILTKATSIRTILRKTPLIAYSNLKVPNNVKWSHFTFCSERELMTVKLRWGVQRSRINIQPCNSLVGGIIQEEQDQASRHCDNRKKNEVLKKYRRRCYGRTCLSSLTSTRFTVNM